jgi:hypothetical protein
MKITNYLVKFYRKAEKRGEKDTYLGCVEIDDVGLGDQLSLTSKAFRQAPPRCLAANLVRVERA